MEEEIRAELAVQIQVVELQRAAAPVIFGAAPSASQTASSSRPAEAVVETEIKMEEQAGE